MTLRNLLTALLLLLFACKPDTRSEGDVAPSPPNIIFIMADDLGIGDLRCYNPDSKIATAHMDRLAREGMRFTDAHSNSAVCTPTRYGVLTGRYSFRSRMKSGVLTGYDPALIEPDRPTVATILSEAGYHTACIGKWHLGLDWSKNDTSRPLIDGNAWAEHQTENVDYEGYVGGGPWDTGFDYGYVLPSSLDIAPYCYIEDGYLTKPMTGHIEAVGNATGVDGAERGVFWRASDLQEDFDLEETLYHFRDKAVAYIEDRAQQKNQPFFLYFPLTAPHTPWLPTDDVRGESDAGRYGDFVLQVDKVIGSVLETLDKTGLAENTLLILTSDNGAHWLPKDIDQFDHRANYIYNGMKSDVWEGGHRMPFLARWPGVVEPGSVSDMTITHPDFLATCAGIVGAEVPDNTAEDSYSYLPVLRGDSPEEGIRPHTIHHSVNGTFAIRKGKWKYIPAGGSGGWSYRAQEGDPPIQLYDLAADPGETRNLQAEYPEVVDELAELLEPYQRIGRPEGQPLAQ